MVMSRLPDEGPSKGAMQDKMEATINSRQEEMKVDFKALTR
jgi:hypothetical protein